MLFKPRVVSNYRLKKCIVENCLLTLLVKIKKCDNILHVIACIMTFKYRFFRGRTKDLD